MNHTALIEAMARAMYEADEGPWGDALMKEMRRYATAALSAIAPAIRAEALEEAGPVREIAAERQRQVSAEGWTPEHDDAHEEGSLACAAGCYAIHAGLPDEARVPKGWAPQDWPWEAEWWKPKDRRRDLIRAGALIVAEIERLDRAAIRAMAEKGPTDEPR